MWWIGKCTIPLNPKHYLALYIQYKESLYWKVIYDKAVELDKSKMYSQLHISYKSSFVAECDQENLSKEKADELKQISILAAITKDANKSVIAIFLKSEISVIQREFDALLIKEGIKLISKHDEALKGWLEIEVTDSQINAFIHLYQQFVSTLFETVDRNSHLDIVIKASFVQQFLTRLKNR